MAAHPEVLVQLRDELVADAEGFDDHRRQHEIIRFGEDEKVRRSPQAVACRKRYVQELGRPHGLLSEEQTGRQRSTVEGKACLIPMGSLIKRSTLSVGEPRTWGRT